MKTSELTGAALDWAVAAALEVQFKEARVVKVCRHEATTPPWIERENAPGVYLYHRFTPSTDWAQGGPIIEREKIDVVQGNDLYFPKGNEHGEHYEKLWLASIGPGRKFHGQTTLQAAMRCYVASKLGDDVDIPTELQ